MPRRKINLAKIRPDLSKAHLTPHQFALPRPRGDFWVFGYGSLMWNPGFKVAQSCGARLFGYHRRLCLWSVHYRGTRRRPGLVLGLDRGGSCRGMAFRVARANIRTVADYLLAREMLNDAYLPRIKKIYLDDGRQVDALMFVSKRNHPQFAAPLSMDETTEVVRAASGKRGKNYEYVLNTVQHLNEFNIRRTALHLVAEKLQQKS